MKRLRLPVTTLLSLAVLGSACDAENPTLLDDLDVEDVELRDLSGDFRNTPVLIQNIDDATCLAFDPSASSFPLERPCDAADSAQLFQFNVQTYVGSIGYVYKVCSADSPSVCLMHEGDGIAAFIDEGQLPYLEGTWYEQVRIQHDETQAFIEFRYSGQCLTPGNPPSAQSCDWFSSTQHYRLVRSCDVFRQDCPTDTKCVPYALEGSEVWNAAHCVPLEPGGGQPGDPCEIVDPATGADTCDQSSICDYVSPDDGFGICTSFCSGDRTAPICNDPSTACVSPDGGSYPLCLRTCDPLVQNCGGSTGAPQTCTPAPGDDTFACLEDTANNQGVHAAACWTDDQCNPGLFCAEQNTVAGCSSSIGCCSDFCDLDAPNPNDVCSGAAGGETCQPWFPNPGATPPGYEHVGFCGIP